MNTQSKSRGKVEDDKQINAAQQKPVNLGSSIFNSGFQNSNAAGVNPFAPKQQVDGVQKPASLFGASAARAPASLQTQAADLPATFADKARLATSDQIDKSLKETQPTSALVPWPPQIQMPEPYPLYHLDADYETLDPTPKNPLLSSTYVPKIDNEADTSSDSKGEIEEAFESSIDRTFQRFAERLAQNPEQVLRYEFAAQPLLYSATDPVGRLFSHGAAPNTNARVQTATRGTTGGIPPCTYCGRGRVFELQLVPHAITELEVEEEGLDGMDWGTIIVGVCKEDCREDNVKGASERPWSWREEWVGVQWEELGEVGKTSSK